MILALLRSNWSADDAGAVAFFARHSTRFTSWKCAAQTDEHDEHAACGPSVIGCPETKSRGHADVDNPHIIATSSEHVVDVAMVSAVDAVMRICFSKQRERSWYVSNCDATQFVVLQRKHEAFSLRRLRVCAEGSVYVRNDVVCRVC